MIVAVMPLPRCDLIEHRSGRHSRRRGGPGSRIRLPRTESVRRVTPGYVTRDSVSTHQILCQSPYRPPRQAQDGQRGYAGCGHPHECQSLRPPTRLGLGPHAERAPPNRLRRPADRVRFRGGSDIGGRYVAHNTSLQMTSRTMTRFGDKTHHIAVLVSRDPRALELIPAGLHHFSYDLRGAGRHAPAPAPLVMAANSGRRAHTAWHRSCCSQTAIAMPLDWEIR